MNKNTNSFIFYLYFYYKKTGNNKNYYKGRQCFKLYIDSL